MTDHPSRADDICVHGGLRRKCETCELLARVQELERERDEWKALYETKDQLYEARVLAHDEALDRIEELEREVARLKETAHKS